MAKRLGIRAYARHRKSKGLPGATHTAVRKAIEAGRLDQSLQITAAGRHQIDPEIADQEWADQTDPAQQREGGEEPAGQKGLFGEVDDPSSSSSPPKNGAAQGRVAYQRAQTLLKTFQAQNARLDYEERVGRLVDAGDVRDRQFEIARAVRDGLLLLPDRCVDELATLDDPHLIREVLDREIREVLTDLAKAAGEATE